MNETSVWYVGMSGQQQGPLGTQQVLDLIRTGQVTQTAYVYGQGIASWTPIAQVPTFAQAFSAAPPPPPPPPAGPAPVATTADVIDYEIFGEEMQFVEVTLDPGEAAIAEAGAFFYMEPGVEMQTIFGDGKPQDQGFFAKLAQAGKRVLTGESLFMTLFGNKDAKRRKVAFAAPYPGKIIAMDLRALGGTLLCEKDAFLCAARGISVGIAFQKKLGVGLFGGEGFVLQKLEGQGLAFVHAGGTIVARELAAGETLRVDTGCIVAFEPRVQYDIQWIGGLKSAFFGGEGLFYAALTGPGKVWLQSLPFSRLARRIVAAGITGGPGEGSVLGGLGTGD